MSRKRITYFSTIILLVLSTILLTQCNKKGKKDFDIPPDVIEGGEYQIAQNVVDDMISNIGSPVEMSALIKSLQIPFSKEYIATLDYSDNYNTSIQKSICLGIFGCDLGYLNMYGKTTTALNYITTIKRLADDIKVGQFFDFETLKRLATNNENLDSLIFISTYSFGKIDDYLRETNRSSLSFAMIAGVWLEGLYLACQVSEDSQSKQIAEKIGEQYLLLDKLLAIMNNFRKNEEIAAIISELKRIDNAYDGISMTIIPGEPKTVEVDGILMLEQNDVSVVNITDEQLKNIIAITGEVRNKIINK